MFRFQWRLRHLRGWSLLIGATSAGATFGMISTVWLSSPTAAVVAATSAVLLGLLGDRSRVLLDRRAEQRRRLPDQAVATDPTGRWRRVRELDDPIALRVHPAEVLWRTVDGRVVGDRVPPYVRRDVQDQLWTAIRQGGFVLLTGESTAGKTRTAYEAVRALFPDHVLIAPASRESIGSVVPAAQELRRCVVWLDDLERFLGVGGLTAAAISRLVGNRDSDVVVLATLRSAEYDRYSPREEMLLNGPARDSWRAARDLLDLAVVIEMQRRWSSRELERARGFTDDTRIHAALGKVGQFGLAEVLAAGPELARDWRAAWSVGAHPHGAAIVAAAVDCRRAGIHEPQPIELLTELAVGYLADRGGALLRPEQLRDALTWATVPSRGVSSLLLPTEQSGHYLAFDYLVDLDGLDRIPQTTWDLLIVRATPDQAFAIGEAAIQRFQWAVAAAAYRKAAQHKVPDADVMMAICLGYSAAPSSGSADAEQSLRILNEAVAERERALGPLAPATLRVRLRLAEHLADRHDPVQAVRMFASLLPDLERALSQDDRDTLAARRLYGYALGSIGQADAALHILSGALHDHERVLGPDHHDTILTRHYIAVFVAESDLASAIRLLTGIRADYERTLGTDSPRVLQTRSLLAQCIGWAGEPTQAARIYEQLAQDRERILGMHHSHTITSWFDAVHWTARAGEHERASEMYGAWMTRQEAATGQERALAVVAEAIMITGSGRWVPLNQQDKRQVADRLWTCRKLLGSTHPLTLEVERLMKSRPVA